MGFGQICKFISFILRGHLLIRVSSGNGLEKGCQVIICLVCLRSRLIRRVFFCARCLIIGLNPAIRAWSGVDDRVGLCQSFGLEGGGEVVAERREVPGTPQNRGAIVSSTSDSESLGGTNSSSFSSVTDEELLIPSFSMVVGPHHTGLIHVRQRFPSPQHPQSSEQLL
ncbi:hypothetical protein Ocin01_04529 [Orchesella cincta]|uniref:Uncharacterized protein n=1 Tax=Orchesella cincta TaxID=48709 RepID=A0A1D2NA58_ORCCI|nr:hypothetical protein Ocin01_04529 [Orchesella cincta]